LPLFYSARERDSYDETRYGASARLRWPVGAEWSASVAGTIERVDIDGIEPDAPAAVREAAGTTDMLSLSCTATHSTVDDRFRPSRGVHDSVEIEYLHGLDGQFDLARIAIETNHFFCVSEDYLGRRSRLTLGGRLACQFAGDSPIFERFFLGGRSLRGFAYRTVAPREPPSSDPVGGDWLLAGRTQYDFPIAGPHLEGAIFADAGTVLDDPGLDQLRVSLGAGLRLFVPQLGQAPLAFDLALPIEAEDHDDERIFSFMIALPF
jgi:outer membrane protein assembly factor BamA